MRNTRYFDLNVYDEQVELPGEPDQATKTKNPFLTKSLTPTQIALSQSAPLRRIGLANERWRQVCEENNDALNELFKKMVGGEFAENSGINFQPFKSGKYWQMMDYLDGNFILRSKKPAGIRGEYQDRMIMEGVLGSPIDSELLQIGWDLAINSALLCDVMPNPRNAGSIFLLEHIVEDEGSLFYPSVTNEFQTRVINDAFWQSLFDSYQLRNLKPLERTLTRYSGELDASLAQDNILRWSQFGVLPEIKVRDSLVSGTHGPESFQGLSRRAIENYGQFIGGVCDVYQGDVSDLNPLIRAYIDAVKCTDQDGIKYFKKDERKRLLDMHWVKIAEERGLKGEED